MFMTDISQVRVSAIHHVAIELKSPFIESLPTGDVVFWRALRLLPGLKSLRLYDKHYTSQDLLDRPNHLAYQVMKKLRGLTELEVVVDAVIARSDETTEKADAKRLE